MWRAVDFLANEYGGGAHAVLESYSLLDVLILIDRANDRKIEDWKMQTQIASYPYFDKRQQDSFMRNLDRMKSTSKIKETKHDDAGFEALKFIMSQNPRIIVK